MNVRVPEFPCASTDVQFTVVVPIEKIDPDVFEQATDVLPSTRSIADTAKLTGAPANVVAGVVMFAGTVSAGGVVSPTVTVNEPDAGLPWRSIAVQVTVVAPIGNVDPDAGAHVTGSAPSTLSVAVPLKVTTAPFADVAALVMLPGTLIVGGVLSNGTTPCCPAPIVCVKPPIDTVTVPASTEKSRSSCRLSRGVTLTSIDAPGPTSNVATGICDPSSPTCISVTGIGKVFSGSAVMGLPVDTV